MSNLFNNPNQLFDTDSLDGMQVDITNYVGTDLRIGSLVEVKKPIWGLNRSTGERIIEGFKRVKGIVVKLPTKPTPRSFVHLQIGKKIEKITLATFRFGMMSLAGTDTPEEKFIDAVAENALANMWLPRLWQRRIRAFWLAKQPPAREYACRDCGLVRHVGQKRHDARALDRYRERALVLGADAAHAPGHDLAALRDELTQLIRVFIVDGFGLFHAKSANLAAAFAGAGPFVIAFFRHALPSFSFKTGDCRRPHR